VGSSSSVIDREREVFKKQGVLGLMPEAFSTLTRERYGGIIRPERNDEKNLRIRKRQRCYWNGRPRGGEKKT